VIRAWMLPSLPLSPVAEEWSWQLSARCRGEDPGIFFHPSFTPKTNVGTPGRGVCDEPRRFALNARWLRCAVITR